MISAKSLMLSVWLFIFSCCVLFLPTFAQSQVGTVTLSVGNGSGPPSSTDNPVQISLDNLDDRTTGVQFDICRGSYLSLSACGNTARTPSISCSSTDLGNGCDRILFFSFGGNFIEMGTGPIITLEYDVSVGAPDPSIGYCQDLTLENVTVTSCEDNGSGGCTTGPPYANVTLEDGQFCFVNPPTCLGVSPGSGMQAAQDIEITITGENTSFVQGVSVVGFEQSGVTVTDTIVDSSTQLRVVIDIAEDASIGFGDVTVTTDTEVLVCANGFQVLEKVETCLSVLPGSGMQGDQGREVTIVGENTSFAQGVTEVSFQNLGITVTGTTVDSPTQLRVTIDVARTAPTGTGNVTVTTGAEVIICANAFEVIEEVIFCLGVSPGSGMQDSQGVEVTITGERTNFEQGVTEVSFENPDITVTDTIVEFPTQLRVLIDIPGNADTGTGDVTVTTGLEIIVCFDAFEVLEKVFEVTEIRESNPTSASFTVSWITDGNANGIVHYSVNPDLSDYETAYDDRGMFHLDDTHHVSIGNLEPETTYYYEIISGGTIDNNGGLYYSFTTMKIPSEPPPNCPVYGWVYMEDGIAPAEGAMVYLQVVHGGEQSYWISALVNSSGIWVLNLGNLYSTVTDDALPYSDGDPIFLEVQGGSGRTFSAEYAVPAICPLNTGSIVLPHFIALDMALYTGFNLISFPFNPMTDENFSEITHTAYSLIEAIPECSQAFSWDASTQRWLTALDIGGGSYIGDDFPIEAGRGYFVKCTSGATSTFYGKEIARPFALTFEPGFNLVSIPYPIDYYTACSLIGAVSGSSKSFSWSPDFQKWLSALVVEGGLCIGDDFAVERDKGYFVHSDVYIGNWVPGVGGTCTVDGDCDDSNICTDDTCVDGTCQYTNNTNLCDDGLFCTDGDQCSGGVCNAGPARDCSAAGDQCNNGVCDDGLDQCVAQPVTDGTTCYDGLFCTQVDECQGGQCIGSDDPCIDNGDFCDGVEYCQEGAGDFLCLSTGDPCPPLTCDELDDTCTGSQATLIVADAYGYAGTIDIELENDSDLVSEVHVDVCDVEQRAWLHIDTASCGTTARSSDFSCAISDLGGGCVRIDLTTAVSGLIDPGTGAIAQMNYTIDAGTPLGDFADLNPQNNDVKDASAVSLSVTPKSGVVGTVECVDAVDCDDLNVCTDDACVGSQCQYTNNTAPCDDTLFCNGSDTCSGGSCSAHAGSPCPETECNTCQEDTDSCFDLAGTTCTDDGNICTDDQCDGVGVCGHPNNTAPCDDTLFCNGSDTCSGGSCSAHAGSPCPETECNTCQEDTDSCFDLAGTVCTDDGNICTDDQCDGVGVCGHPNNTAPCDDTLFCNGSDTCSGGSCSAHAGSPCPETECNTCQEDTDSCFDLAGTVCTDDGNICTDDECDGVGVCSHPDNNDPCDDGLYCTQVDECLGGQCIGSDDPCVDNGDFCDGVEYCEEDIADYICSSTGDPCELPLTCDEDNDICDVSDVSLIIADAYGYAGTIDIELENAVDSVSEVHVDVCDIDQRVWLHIDTASCSTTARSSDFSCAISDLGGGCVRIDLTTAVSGLIDPGTGAIAQMNYTIDAGTPPGDIADLNPQNNDVKDASAVSLSVTPKSGVVGTVECVDAVDCDDLNVCTDDACVGSQCQYTNNTAPCDDTLFCNGSDTCSGGSCSAHAGSPCPETECNTCQEDTDSCFDLAGTVCTDDGNICTDDQCDGVGVCEHPNNTAPCDDNLFCNGADTCSGGSCSVNAGSPCPETECNTCQEDTDSCFDTAGTLCTDDGNICTDDQCDGAGVCEHPNNTAPCDDNLFCNGADTCSGGSCSVNAGSPCPETECNTCQEDTDSCFDTAGTLCTDDGNICTDDQCDGAGVCEHPNNTAPCDDNLFCNGADTCSGGSCSVNAGSPCPETECNTCQEDTDSCFDLAGTTCTDDGNICTDDQCDGAGVCEHPNNTAPCDDNLFCNGADTCSGGSCSVNAGSPCPETECNTCQEDTDSCFDLAGTTCTDDGNICTDDQCDGVGVCEHPNNTAPCDDTLFCNGADTCSGGSCSVNAGSPCPETECNTCQEDTDSCFDLAGTTCTDDGNICTDDQCDGVGVCSHPDNNDPCDDELYCTQIDECQDGQCIGSDDPCIDNGDFCDGVEYCEEDIADYICSSTGDPCDALLTCDELGDVCDVSDVTLIVADAYGYAGTIDIELDNPLDYVSEVHLDVCDIDLRSWLTIDTASCSTTARTSDFSCAISDLGGGCVRIDLTTAVSGLIDPSATGPEAIAQMNYSIDVNASLVDYADVEPQNIDIQDDTPVSLSVTPVPGRVRAVE